MSTEINDPRLPEGITLHQFWGGPERGLCCQITGPEVLTRIARGPMYSQMLQLTPAEARAVAFALMDWAASRGDTLAQVDQGRRILATQETTPEES